MRLAARRVLLVVFALASVVAVSAIGGASASAEVTHNFEFSFDGSATPPGFFEGEVSAVAIDQANDYAYVADYEADAVYKFDLSGKYLGEIAGAAVPQGSLGLFYTYSGIAVDNSSGPNRGDLYVAGSDNGVVYRFDASGKLLSELNGSGTPAGSFDPRGVAVNSGGDLYVADAANDVVDEFDAAGNYVSQIASAEITEPASIAVNSSGDIYLNNYNENTIELEPGGGASVLDANRTYSVAVDPVSGDVYLGEREYPSPGDIAEYDHSGKRLGTFGEERLGYVDGIAVFGASGEVYAADSSNKLIDVFGPGIVIPDGVTEAASSIQPSSATLNGTVDPDGLPVTACQFEYGTSSSYGQSAPCAQSPASIGSGTGPVTVSADASGLSADTEYHFRLAVSNANGTNRGADVTLTTSGPPRIDGESVEAVNRTTASLQGQIDPFGFDTTYRFEYGTSTAYGSSVPVPDADIGSGMGEVPVSQVIGQLLPATTYHYRIVATNAQGTVDGTDQTFTTVPPAYIDSEFVTSVASSSVTLNAEVNPNGTSTEYRLEYGTNSSYGQTLAGNVGEGTSDVLVSYHRQELSPGTTYHYRIVVHNKFGTVEGTDHTFTTQATGGQELALPDGRAWELVSPADKNGALVGILRSEEPFQAAADGSAIAYPASEPVGEGAAGRNIDSEILSRRGPDGWSSQDISAPNSLVSSEEGSARHANRGAANLKFFSADLLLGLSEPAEELDPVSLSAEATERTLYLRDSVNGSYLPLETRADVAPGVMFGDKTMEFFAGTPDLSHVVFGTTEALTPGAVAAPTNTPASHLEENLYEWSGGKLQLVNVTPATPASPEGKSEPGAFLGDEEFGNGVTAHALSNDGRWVVWTHGELLPYGAGGGVGGPLSLYVRDMVAGKTFQLGGEYPRFETMSADGSKVFFTDTDEGRGGDLYVFDTATGTSTDLTANHGVREANAGVQDAVMGASEDGSYVYFVATGVLASGAVSGADNVYVLHNSQAGWTTKFIATLAAEDSKSWRGTNQEIQPPVVEGAGVVDPEMVSSRVSPDGRYLAFMSERSLTGYDNLDALSGQPDEEVYLYDAVSARLICSSCNPTGARPVGVFDDRLEGNALLVDLPTAWSAFHGTANHWLAGSIPGWVRDSKALASYQPRYLSDSGRLFFDSPDALVPQDTNGLEDAYEYEPAGVGSCTAAVGTFVVASGGCVSLISSGQSASESVFVDASETGDDVFFASASKLVGRDYDTAYDIYDARVCSSEAPCSSEPVSSPPCTSGDSCKAAPSPQPEIFGPTPSATFSGVGNVVEEPKTVVKPKAKAKAKPKKHAKHKKRKAQKRRKAEKGRKGGKARGTRSRRSARKGGR